MDVKIELNKKQIFDKVTNPKLGLYVSQTWKKLIDPYTPRDTGQLMGITGQTVVIKPFELHYTSNYASYVYDNPRGVTFITSGSGRNPYATDHWDEKAAAAGQKDKLIRSTNAALKSGKF